MSPGEQGVAYIPMAKARSLTPLMIKLVYQSQNEISCRGIFPTQRTQEFDMLIVKVRLLY